jgi:hypothetical protein
VLRNNAKACESALANHQGKLSEFMQKKSAPRSDVALHLSEGKIRFTDAETIMKQMSSLLDMFKEAAGAA